MANTSFITFGKVEYNKYDKPILPVYSEKDGKETTQYLMWFRKSFFQVCATPEGEWDLGASEWVPESMHTNKAVMKAFAIEALMRFGSNNYSDIRYSTNFTKDIQIAEYIDLVIGNIIRNM